MSFIEKRLRALRSKRIINSDEMEEIYKKALLSLGYKKEETTEVLELLVAIRNKIDVYERLVLDDILIKNSE